MSQATRHLEESFRQVAPNLMIDVLLFLGGKRLAGNPTGSDLVQSTPKTKTKPQVEPEGWDEILDNLDRKEYKEDAGSFVDTINVELLKEIQGSALFKNATKYLDDIIIDNGKANPSKLKEIRLALEKGEFSYEEVAEIYNIMCRLNISGAYEKELVENMNFGKYLSAMVGAPPANMCDPHAHHILFKVGNGEKQKELVKQGREILRKYGIDPIAGKEVLCWAPNRVLGQHSYDTLKELVDELQFVDELKLTKGIKYKRILKTMESFKRKAAKR